MRKTRLPALTLSAALAALPLLAPLRAHAQLAGDAAAAPAAKPADANVPVKVVVLFSSGVGYFEHSGSVKGNASTELRFKTNQINDILKSLLLQDMAGGKVTTVVYPSQDPIDKTLKSFQVDLAGNPSLAELLSQLRGAKVQILAGSDTLAGTILGLEKKPKTVGDKGNTVEVWVINLITGGTIRSVELSEARKIELEDPQLQSELAKALGALAQSRDQDKKPVTINFSGQGDRPVRIGYVVETPVWKTSYRLVLPGEGAEKGKDKPRLLGWAIVENQTDNDWTDVQLSLVSGRPISFIQDLYRPLYVPRPVVQPELYASLRPQTYDAGMGKDEKAVAEAQELQQPIQRESLARRGMNAPAAAAPRGGAGGGQFGAGGGGGGRGGGGANDSLALGDADKAYQPMTDLSASVASLASASKVGELFQYTVGNVSLPRQRSAMIPIVTDDVEIERLSIYNPAVMPRNPLYGARVKNTTGKHLLQGPITVLEGASYAGDARIDNVPPGQERLISYGVDLQVLVDGTKGDDTDVIQTGKIVKGVLELTRKLVHTHHYTAENKGDKDKTLIVEHPRRGDEWKLVEPAKPLEKTDQVYRFKESLPAGKSASVKVVEELISRQQIALLGTDVGTLEIYGRTDRIPQSVRDVINKAIALANAMTDTQRQIDEHRAHLKDVTTEQTRIRENIKTVDRSDYATRLLKKLNDQETAIEKLQTETNDLEKKLNAQGKEYETYLQNTSVDDKQ